jgi:hypothetical protein
MLAADHGLPHLKVACDAERMRQILTTHLRSHGNHVPNVQHCQIYRIRYRPGRRCVLQYELTMNDPVTGREQTHWITGRIYADDQVQRTRKNLPDSLEARDLSDHLLPFQPVSFISELRMYLQVFPYDRRIRTLPILMKEPSPELSDTLLSRFGPGAWRSGTCRIEPVCYRSGQRAILRYRVQARDITTNRTEQRGFYVKVYRNNEGENTHRLLQLLSVSSGNDSTAVESPVAYLKRLRALVVEQAPGTSLRQILLDGRESVPAMRKVARTLAGFNQQELRSDALHTHKDELADLKHVAKTLRTVCSPLSAEVDAIVADVGEKLVAVPPAPTHRDLKPEHIWLDGERVVLIDLDRFAGADPVQDAAKLLVRTLAMPILLALPAGATTEAAQAFADEYFDHVPRSWRTRLPVKYAVATLHLAAHIFRDQVPNWPDKIAILLESARDSMKGRIW